MRPVKNEWRGAGMVTCLGRGTDFVYGPADTTTTHCLLLQEIQIGFGFTFLVPAHLGSPGQNPESRKMVVVVVVVVALNSSIKQKKIKYGNWKRENLTKAWKDHKKSIQNARMVISLSKEKKQKESASNLNHPEHQNEISRMAKQMVKEK